MSEITKLPDGSAFFIADVMSKQEAMSLPPEKRPLCYRVSSEIYHATFEAIGEASMAWNPPPSHQVFASERASKIATDLLFKFADEFEGRMAKSRPTLDELAHVEKVPELWTDKKSATPGYICHDYLRLYDREFSKWRDEPIKLLEIGLNKGASIKLWLEYFTKAEIFGIDISPWVNGVGIEDFSRFTFVQGDAGSVDFWKDYVFPNPLSIVIDDGAHFSGPIHTAFRALWEHVAPGGYYIVEDITEVRNPESRTPGFPNQLEFVQNFVEPVIFGTTDIDEVFVSKDLVMLRKKL